MKIVQLAHCQKQNICPIMVGGLLYTKKIKEPILNIEKRIAKGECL